MMTQELSPKILSHMEKIYAQTNWPFFSMVDLQNIFRKQDIKPALNELRKEGLIRRREGMNTVLIELIKDE